MTTHSFDESMRMQRTSFEKIQKEMNGRCHFASCLNGSTITVQYESGELRGIQVASSNFVMVEAPTKLGNKRLMFLLNIVGAHTVAYCIDNSGLKKGLLESLYYAHSDVTLRHEGACTCRPGKCCPSRSCKPRSNNKKQDIRNRPRSNAGPFITRTAAWGYRGVPDRVPKEALRLFRFPSIAENLRA